MKELALRAFADGDESGTTHSETKVDVASWLRDVVEVEVDLSRSVVPKPITEETPIAPTPATSLPTAHRFYTSTRPVVEDARSDIFIFDAGQQSVKGCQPRHWSIGVPIVHLLMSSQTSSPPTTAFEFSA